MKKIFSNNKSAVHEADTSKEGQEELSALYAGGENKKNTKKSKLIRKIVIIVFILAIIFIIISLSGKKETVLPMTSELKRGTIESLLTVTGPVEGTDSVDVTSNLHAKVTELNVKEGDRVTADETVLARLDVSDIRKEIENARGSCELIRAQREEKLRDEQAEYEKALQDLNTAREDMNRKAVLFQSGDISKVDYEAAANALNDAERVISGFNIKDGRVAADKSLDIELENSERALRQAEEKLSDAVIKAPISGTVTRVYTKQGKFADNTDEDNNPMIVIENLDKLQMEIKISEYSIGKVKEGQKVEISADILGPETVEGEIADISPTGEEKGGGSTERVIPTTVSIENNSKLIAGITAKARITLERAEDALSVPVSAIFDDGGGNKYVQFIVPTGKNGAGAVKSVPVKTGVEGDLDVEIKEILSEEDKELLREGSLCLSSYDEAAEGLEGNFSGSAL